MTPAELAGYWVGWNWRRDQEMIAHDALASRIAGYVGVAFNRGKGADRVRYRPQFDGFDYSGKAEDTRSIDERIAEIKQDESRLYMERRAAMKLGVRDA